MEIKPNHIQTVLIVDDSPTIHSFVKAHLLGEPVEIVSAYDGNEGLSIAQSTPPDLILLDVEMPGLSGFEVLDRLRQKYSLAELPVIMATALGENADVVRALSQGASDYLVKPFDFAVAWPASRPISL